MISVTHHHTRDLGASIDIGEGEGDGWVVGESNPLVMTHPFEAELWVVAMANRDFFGEQRPWTWSFWC